MSKSETPIIVTAHRPLPIVSICPLRDKVSIAVRSAPDVRKIAQYVTRGYGAEIHWSHDTSHMRLGTTPCGLLAPFCGFPGLDQMVLAVATRHWVATFTKRHWQEQKADGGTVSSKGSMSN